MSHTPGPWTDEGADPFGDHNISPPHERAVVAAVVSNVRPSAEIAANARLIAAAPDMLEALRQIEAETIDHAAVRIARAAITKAVMGRDGA